MQAIFHNDEKMQIFLESAEPARFWEDTNQTHKSCQKPILGEKLFLYLAASDSALSSAVLIRAEGQFHLPIYFVRETLNDAELKYPPLEMLA